MLLSIVALATLSSCSKNYEDQVDDAISDLERIDSELYKIGKRNNIMEYRDMLRNNRKNADTIKIEMTLKEFLDIQEDISIVIYDLEKTRDEMLRKYATE